MPYNKEKQAEHYKKNRKKWLLYAKDQKDSMRVENKCLKCMVILMGN